MNRKKELELAELHSSGENYLKVIYILKQKKRRVCSVNVTEYRGVSKPSVSHAVKKLRDA